MEDFQEEYGSTDYNGLIDYDISLPEEHDKFIEHVIWCDTYMNQIEFVIHKMFPSAMNRYETEL